MSHRLDLPPRLVVMAGCVCSSDRPRQRAPLWLRMAPRGIRAKPPRGRQGKRYWLAAGASGCASSEFLISPGGLLGREDRSRRAQRVGCKPRRCGVDPRLDLRLSWYTGPLIQNLHGPVRSECASCSRVRCSSRTSIGFGESTACAALSSTVGNGVYALHQDDR